MPPWMTDDPVMRYLEDVFSKFSTVELVWIGLILLIIFGANRLSTLFFKK